jgi:hypothetical protein
MSLSIHALTLRRPSGTPRAPHMRGYRHLDTAAGFLSVPPSQAARAALGYHVGATDPAIADAGLRSVELADLACAELLKVAGPERAGAVRNLVHCQATLDEQPLVSTCMKVGLMSLPAVSQAFTVGQLGTAPVPSALVLARSNLRAGLGASVITAADKWLAPFDRQFGALVTYADAAGALLVGEGAGIARIHVLEARVLPQRRPFWDRALDLVAAEMIEHVGALLRDCLAEAGWRAEEVDIVLGDRYGCDIPARIAQAGGLPDSAFPPDADRGGAHLSSAEFMHSLAVMLRAACARAAPTRGVIWTAAPSGAVAVALLECDAREAQFTIRDGIESIASHPFH